VLDGVDFATVVPVEHPANKSTDVKPTATDPRRVVRVLIAPPPKVA